MPQTGPDLVGAGYAISNPIASLIAGTSNTYQPNVPARSNIYFQLGQIVDSAIPTEGSDASSHVWSQAVPVVPGDVITKITYLTGGSGNVLSSPQYSWGAIYAGTGSAPALIGQSTDLAAQAVAAGCTTGTAASAPYTGLQAASASSLSYTLTSPQTITTAQAPYGFIYVSLHYACGASATAATATSPSLISMTCGSGSGIGRQWFTNGPRMLSFFHNACAGSTAPSTMSTMTAVSAAPIVFLT